MPIYLGERYIPNAKAHRTVAEGERLRRAIADAGARSAVRLLSTTFVADEEWVFDVFEARSAAAVEAIYVLGGVAYERVIEAVHVRS